MASVNGTSAYQQINYTFKARNMGSDRAGASDAHKAERDSAVKEETKVETKAWSPIDPKSSLVPRTTEYGNTIGDVQLSDKAKAYYDTLKSKFHNMEFIAVSKDMKGQVQQNAAAYGHAGKMVVLIDEEKIERMATDESYRKKYESIIAGAQNKMAEAKKSLTSTGALIKNFGMSVDSDGKESFFATVEKSQALEKKRIEKKAAEKKELKAKEKKKAEKKAQEDRIQKRKDEKKAEENKKAEDKARENSPDQDEIPPEIEKRIHDKVIETYGKEYVTIEADSMDDLLSKVQSYSYNNAANRVMTDAERAVGSHFDFRG